MVILISCMSVNRISTRLSIEVSFASVILFSILQKSFLFSDCILLLISFTLDVTLSLICLKNGEFIS